MAKKRIITTSYKLVCDICEQEFTAKYQNTQYCCDACKQKAYREGMTIKKNDRNRLELKLIEERKIEKQIDTDLLREENRKKELENERKELDYKILHEENVKKEREKKQEEERNAKQMMYEQLQLKQQQAVNRIINKIFK